VIALDSSAAIAFLSGAVGRVADAAASALDQQHACLPPVVLAELLSEPTLRSDVATLLKSLPRLDVLDGYWERSGELRRAVLKRSLRARLADTLIAQSCIDHRVPLVTGDRDFRHFRKHGLVLLPAGHLE
jgi:predicted nucleic acid-binding protein